MHVFAEVLCMCFFRMITNKKMMNYMNRFAYVDTTVIVIYE